MTARPIFLATHPRSCSTAFERVFMTRADLECIHEPFGDAFYYGPERLSSRFENDEQTRVKSGFSESTFKTVLDNFEAKSAEGKRLFIKDMAYYLMPPNGAPATLSPSCSREPRGIGTPETHSNSNLNDTTNTARVKTDSGPQNPTVLTPGTLQGYHFVFLIRHPRYSIPSYFRCTTPPLDQITGFYEFIPNEAGYVELRRLFDYLRLVGEIGPRISDCDSSSHDTNDSQTNEKQASFPESTGYQTNSHENGGHGSPNGYHGKANICVVDADDLLDYPADIVSAFCKSVGLEYDESMLKWDSGKDQKQAKDAFEKWKGFHEDAMNSKDLKPRTHHKKIKPEEVEDAEWREKFGEGGAKIIRETVNANVADYEYLKQFALKV